MENCKPAKDRKGSFLAFPFSGLISLDRICQHVAKYESNDALQLAITTIPCKETTEQDTAGQAQPCLLTSSLGPYLYLMKRLEYRKIKGQELLLNVAGPKRSFCARNLRSKMDLN